MTKHAYFGQWKFDAAVSVLSYPVNDVHDYDINLYSIVDSATMLDWIMQVAAKNWATGECVAGLIEAFRILFNPQASICGLGRNRTIDPHQLDFRQGLGREDKIRANLP